eukprot:CAMPEP_0202945124 /NCGR_PEP_ID=MMETSP1395-20130829/6084_1 /ASSEMBLY_ACC=CAM_ASM_000871 /TAXON_ID=5961 /ORGANISM="Blepharisma japonicum, Strain Stock R1072" /LENGTH=78 /DNA_ID=CAMNT_0049644771 /DNA_START=31 /DNA_END=268 /DNA_ORIENTATION=+
MASGSEPHFTESLLDAQRTAWSAYGDAVYLAELNACKGKQLKKLLITLKVVWSHAYSHAAWDALELQSTVEILEEYSK